MAKRRFSSALQTVNEINITPLTDLTFMLLITFVMTAPMLEYQFDVSPPRMVADKIDEERSEMINLNASGQIIYQRQTVDPAELTRRLLVLRNQRPDVTILIRADGDRRYREVIDVMKAVRAANITNVSLVTQPEDIP